MTLDLANHQRKNIYKIFYILFNHIIASVQLLITQASKDMIKIPAQIKDVHIVLAQQMV